MWMELRDDCGMIHSPMDYHFQFRCLERHKTIPNIFQDRGSHEHGRKSTALVRQYRRGTSYYFGREPEICTVCEALSFDYERLCMSSKPIVKAISAGNDERSPFAKVSRFSSPEEEFPLWVHQSTCVPTFSWVKHRTGNTPNPKAFCYGSHERH